MSSTQKHCKEITNIRTLFYVDVGNVDAIDNELQGLGSVCSLHNHKRNMLSSSIVQMFE